MISLDKWLTCKNIKIPQLYLVGGTVRDLLLNRSPRDIDLVCKGAGEFARSLAGCRKAALVPMEKKPDEPCYRVIDREKPDNFLDIAEMKGETIYTDLKQRDFTINAIALEVNSDGSPGKTIDPLNGAEDIANRIIKLADAGSLASDPVRILRVFRFAATLGFSIERSAVKEMGKRALLLGDASEERIMAELMFVLKSPQSSRFFRQMDLLGILDVIFPEIISMKGCAQNGFHHKDVWEHSLLVMDNCEKIINSPAEYFGDVSAGVGDNLVNNDRLEFLKLAALLHDIGKPPVSGFNPDTGRITFYRHAELGAIIIDGMARRLKMSARDRELLVLLTAEHLHLLNLFLKGVKTSTKMRWFRKMKDDSVPAIVLGMADVMSSLGPESAEDYREDLIARLKKGILEYHENIKAKIDAPDFINGRDLISLGMGPGPEMGRMLDLIRSAQDTGKISSREQGLEMAKKLITDFPDGPGPKDADAVVYF